MSESISVADDGFGFRIERDEARAVVVPVGELDLATVGRVDAPLHELCVAGVRELVLDLRRVTFMDSSAIQLLLHWERRAPQLGVRFAIILGAEGVRRPLELTGVLGLLSVVGAPA